MIELSKNIIKSLDKIIVKEKEYLPTFTLKKYIEERDLPGLISYRNIHCNIAVVAAVSAGKSTLFNALCGYPILPAAKGITSSVPTYINRVKSHDDECVKVCRMKEETTEINGVEYTCFVKTSATASFKANNIDKDMFNELFNYMFKINNGDKDGNIKTTIENVAYFMNDREKARALFKGTDAQKHALTQKDYALEYNNPRHRLLLLLILLCVYVEQNTEKKHMDVYIKELNDERNRLLKKYKIPAEGDYCVYLDWCSEDLPEDVTLIDLPGTGSSTEDTASQSSHTRLVRGILEEADAVWALCSDKGIEDPDTASVLNDVTVGNEKKNKVCIYNCKDNDPSNSVPVRDFIKKIPSFAGERCYVVNALAGEYKYTKNGVDMYLTKTASDQKDPIEGWPNENKMTIYMEYYYMNDNAAYCSFDTSKDSGGNMTVVQNQEKKYTLKTFFEKALTDYVGRLKYELALKQFTEQLEFYIKIGNQLVSSRNILSGLKGQDWRICKAITEALKESTDQASKNYIEKSGDCTKNLNKKIEPLSEELSETINKEFNTCLIDLITKIKAEWKTLVTPGHINCMETNIFGKYGMGPDNPNLAKFTRVCNNTKAMINASAFETALKLANDKIGEFLVPLTDYTNNLKNTTKSFENDYITIFLKEFDKEQESILGEDKSVTTELKTEFLNTRKQLKDAIEDILDIKCKEICKSFDDLISEEGIFDTLRDNTAADFRKLYNDAVVAAIRTDMITPYNNIKKCFLGGIVSDSWNFTDIRTIYNLLNSNLSENENVYKEKLSKIITAVYGNNLGKEGENGKNFPQNLLHKTGQFATKKITNGACKTIEGLHDTVSSLIKYAAQGVLNVNETIVEIDEGIKSWAVIKADFEALGKTLKGSDVPRTNNLYLGCKKKIEEMATKKKNK